MGDAPPPLCRGLLDTPYAPAVGVVRLSRVLSWSAVAIAITRPRCGTPIPVPTETMVLAFDSRSPVTANASVGLVVEVTVMGPAAPRSWRSGLSGKAGVPERVSAPR